MEPEDLKLTPENLAKLIGLVENKTINRTVAKEVFEVVLRIIDPIVHVEEKGLKIAADDGTLRVNRKL